MPAINFQEEFASRIRYRLKRTTIRRVRKNPIKVGDMLTMFTGQRSPKCVKLGEFECLMVKPVEIGPAAVKIDDKDLDPDALTFLAIAEGFESVGVFRDFFREQYGLPFRGVLIAW